ncbi:MAG TPA: response regulator transcription factor [Steroidobacteraceae bacterium]|jgi:DNA-binding response OmpR family regulator|nr:response regulator transcription factor [Steroidobacteraceae bacterium]
MRILLVEDDELLADAIARGLTLDGFTVDHAGSAEQARAAIPCEHFDLAIVDIGLPGADGLSLLHGLRGQGSAMPVLILTARDGLADKVRAFGLGADDFLMKPFEQAELAARCKALVRRANLAPSGAVHLGRLNIDLLGHQLRIDAQPVELTRREWAVLESLTHNLGRVVTKERMLQSLAGWDQDLTANAVETHVSRLRAKLDGAAVIRAVRGLGYRLEEAAGQAPG